MYATSVWGFSYEQISSQLRGASPHIVYCRLVVVIGGDCRLSTAALGLLYYPRMIAM
jgi:hypothetical protein